MSSPRSRPRRPSKCRRAEVLRGFCWWLVVALCAACGATPEESPPAESYKVRGIVRQLPVPQRAAQELVVRHEAIAEFKDADGEVVGMESMTMPFPVDDAELIAGLEAGDRIALDFEVRWDEGHPLRITAIEKLPPETRLGFETDAASE